MHSKHRERVTLRYDDRLETIMNARTRDAGARSAMWVQLVDVLAQDRGNFPPELRANAYRWLEKWRAEVPEKRRAGVAESLSGRRLPIALVDFFAKDAPIVAAPIMTRGVISSPGWVDGLASWPPRSRALLAERSDLPDDMRRALASLGSQALALPAVQQDTVLQPIEPAPFPPLTEKPTVIMPANSAEDQAPSQLQDVGQGAAAPLDDSIFDLQPETIVTVPTGAIEPQRIVLPKNFPSIPLNEANDSGVKPIGALLQRIERYRRDNPASSASRQSSKVATAFVFEADRSGLINWVDGAPRGALIGLSIAEMALPGEGGVDGQAAGAFRKRTPFDHARLHVMGHGAAAGAWLVSGAPLFEPESGRFLGYQGQARRMAEPAQESTGELLGGSLRPASVRQLVHELRTPLNAIRGFAEMIEGQFLGPVEDAYRTRATAIIKDSALLLRVFEDLENAARLESGDYALSPDARTDLNRLTRDVLAFSAPLTERHQLNLRVQLPDETVEAAVDEASSRQLLTGFIELLAGVAADNHLIAITLHPRESVALLEAYPASDTRAKWDWSATIADDAELRPEILPLGIGYKLRLLARLADRVGGSLHATGDRLSLLLPLTSATEGQTRNG